MAPSRVSPPPSESPSSNKYGDFRDDFFRDGYVIIKGAVPKDRAKAYQDSALSWLEGFNIGFDRNDKATWKKENLPQSWKGGMYLHFAAAHEKYVWEARQYDFPYLCAISAANKNIGSQELLLHSQSSGARRSCSFHLIPLTLHCPSQS